MRVDGTHQHARESVVGPCCGCPSQRTSVRTASSKWNDLAAKTFQARVSGEKAAPPLLPPSPACRTKGRPDVTPREASHRGLVRPRPGATLRGHVLRHRTRHRPRRELRHHAQWPVPRFIEGGRIIVTALATFAHEDEALAFLPELRGVDVQERERTPRDLEALERVLAASLPD